MGPMILLYLVTQEEGTLLVALLTPAHVSRRAKPGKKVTTVCPSESEPNVPKVEGQRVK